MKQSIPNILTVLRVVLCLVMFAAFYMIYRGISGAPMPEGWTGQMLARTALISFVVAAVTDFFDGYLARRWNVVSMFGAVLDPIADKILVCGAIVGLITVQSGLNDSALGGWIIIPGTLILFREFAVSAMREVLAPKGIKLPVTFLAKTKTTLQLIALAGLIFFMFWPAWGLPVVPWLMKALHAAGWLFALSAAITVWTGIEYALTAKKALAAA